MFLSSSIRRATTLRFGSQPKRAYCLRTASLRQQPTPMQYIYGAIRSVLLIGSEHARSVHTMAAIDTVGGVRVERVPALRDNYVWIVTEPSGRVAVVDPSETGPVLTALGDRRVDYVMNTHHHWDHTGGNMELKKRFNCQIVGPAADHDRIPGIDIQVKDGDRWKFGELEAQVFDTPGHTRGHITYWFPQAAALFPGDTLFAMGCGRLFEGTPQQMWSSLSKLLPLPRETRVFCAHEYTQSNAKFAVTVDPENTALQQRKANVDEMREKGIPTIPSLLGEELDTNPFLRPSDAKIRAGLGYDASTPDWEVFGAIRKAKDNF